MKKYIALIVIMTITGLSLSAQPNRGKGFRNAGGPCYQQFGERGFGMDLTDEQQEAIRELRVEHMKNTLPLRNQMQELAAEYRSLITQDEPNMGAVENNIDQRAEVRKELQKIRAEHRLEVRSQLTDDQKVLFDSRRMNRSGKGNFNGRRGNFGGRRGYGQGYGQGNGPWCPWNDQE